MLFAALMTLMTAPAFAEDADMNTNEAVAAEKAPAVSGRVLYYYGRLVWRTGLRSVRHANGEIAFDTQTGECFDRHGAPVAVDLCSVTLVDGATMRVARSSETGLVVASIDRPERKLRKLKGPEVAYSGS